MNNPFINKINNPFINNPLITNRVVYTPYISEINQKPEDETKDEDAMDYVSKLLRSYYTPRPVVTSEPEDETTDDSVETPVDTPTTSTTPTSTISEQKTYTNREEFLKDMSDAYYRVLTKSKRFSDKDAKEYARRLAIKDGLETNFGKSKPKGTFNYGNITVGPESSASYTEGSDHDANGNPITQRFRNFSSLDDYLEYQINNLYRPDGRYAGIFTGDYAGFYDRLKNAGYAEDKEYASKLNTLYRQYYGNVPIAKYGGILTKKADPFRSAYKREYDLSWNPFK